LVLAAGAAEDFTAVSENAKKKFEVKQILAKILQIWGLYYKTYYGCNLQTFVIS
jgi:hypothetical protein